MASFFSRFGLFFVCFWLGGCSAPPEQAAQPFRPGVPGRGTDEVCNSSSPECQHWTALAIKCEDNMRQRDAGHLGPLEPYCDQAEQYREQVTGVPDSSSPGAYGF